MTSPGLKRPLEHDVLAQTTCLSASGVPHQDATGGEPNQNSLVKVEMLNNFSNALTDEISVGSTNGNKRRCTTNHILHKTNNQHLTNSTASNQSAQDQPSVSPTETTIINSPFKDPSPTLMSLNVNIASLIEKELQHVDSDRQECKTNQGNVNDAATLTVNQTQTICEKLVRDLDKSLREDYDRILTRKLAEQYDIFAKASYLSTFVESAQRVTAPVAPSMISPPTQASGVQSNPSINAFAATLQMQRSLAAATVAPSSQPPTTTPNSITDLSHLAASLTAANGHPSAISNAPHHLSYNSFQQQAALQHQAAVHHHSHHQQQQAQHLTMQHRVPTASLAQNSATVAGSTIPTGPVLLTSNLDEQLAVPEALFTLFGVFGDVVRVKILFNKKDNALIQMADATQAQVAQSYLDKQRIFGKVVRVTRSKHLLVQMPRDGTQSDAGLTKDFTNSPLHRFKFPGSRNYLNIYPPSNTLHISNIPSTIDENHLQKAFKELCGFEFTSFKFFPKDRKMALMKFVSTEHATIALIRMHNFQISEENNLRVSFSKTLI